MNLKCDICGTVLNGKNIGYIKNPYSGEGEIVRRCKKCYREIKSQNPSRRKSSYILLKKKELGEAG